MAAGRGQFPFASFALAVAQDFDDPQAGCNRVARLDWTRATTLRTASWRCCVRCLIGRRPIGLEGQNPAAHVRQFKEHSRARFLDGEELQRFFQSLAQEENEAVVITLRFRC